MTTCSLRLPAVVSSTGLLFVVVLLAELIVVLTRSQPAPPAFYSGVVTSLPFICGLVYGGYWLTASELPPDQYTQIARWWMGGLILAVLLIFPINSLIRPVTLKVAVGTIRWSGAIGGMIGLLLGVFQARAIQQAVEAEQARLHQQRVQRQRDRLEKFTEIASHDIRTPLDTAQGHLRILENEYDNPHLDAIQTAHDRIDEIITKTLTLAEAGQTIGETTPVDLTDIADTVWGRIKTAEATLQIEQTATIKADRERVEHLFLNLFQNAVEHGGDAVTIRVGTLQNAAGFYVEDDGVGIPESEREKVFERGYSSVDDGVGFGLSIVETVAEAHDWTINLIDSEKGGARFEFAGVEFESE